MCYEYHILFRNRRFLPINKAFLNRVKPLTKLTKSNTLFVFGEGEKQTFTNPKGTTMRTRSVSIF